MLFTNPNKSKSFQLPGKSIAQSITLTYLGIILVFPLVLLLITFFQIPMDIITETLSDVRLWAALKVTVATAFCAALVNLIFGTLIAWIQARYTYIGKSIVTMLIDIPFALPTSVAGIALTAAFSHKSGIGKWLHTIGIDVNYTPLGITIALIFIGIPFVIRQVEPILEEIGTEMEQAAQMLGATPFQIATKIILPNIIPAALAGFTAAFARGLGEYGSVIFISGNMPMKTEVVSLIIVSKLEQFNYAGATIISVVMLSMSLVFLLISNGIQVLQKKKYGLISKGTH
jgi:sulfate transport system permease protein